MSLITPADVTAVLSTDLDSAALQSIIDREEAEMVRRFGANADGVTAFTETFTLTGADIFTSRPISSLTSISVVAYVGASPSTLATSQYYRVPPLNQIRISPFLTDSFVTVTYVPANDQALRKQVLLDLVRLAMEQFSTSTGKVSGLGTGKVSGLGFSIERGGGASASDRNVQREQLYSRLTLQAV